LRNEPIKNQQQMEGESTDHDFFEIVNLDDGQRTDFLGAAPQVPGYLLKSH
jgi:hypothetical protein